MIKDFKKIYPIKSQKIKIVHKNDVINKRLFYEIKIFNSEQKTYLERLKIKTKNQEIKTEKVLRKWRKVENSKMENRLKKVVNHSIRAIENDSDNSIETNTAFLSMRVASKASNKIFLNSKKRAFKKAKKHEKKLEKINKKYEFNKYYKEQVDANPRTLDKRFRKFWYKRKYIKDNKQRLKDRIVSAFQESFFKGIKYLTLLASKYILVAFLLVIIIYYFGLEVLEDTNAYEQDNLIIARKFKEEEEKSFSITDIDKYLDQYFKNIDNEIRNYEEETKKQKKLFILNRDDFDKFDKDKFIILLVVYSNDHKKMRKEVDIILSKIFVKKVEEKKNSLKYTLEIKGIDDVAKKILTSEEYSKYEKLNKYKINGEMTPPVDDWEDKISDHFGPRTDPVTGEVDSFHYGIDLADAIGSPIYAALPGIVTYADWYGNYGNLIVIEHYDGISTLYGHLDGFYVKVGQTVKSGQLIAPMGTTGKSTGSHLHFEYRINNECQDPYIYLPRRKQ